MGDLVMVESKKLTPEELEPIKQVQQRYSDVQLEYGRLFIERTALESRINEIEQRFRELAAQLDANRKKEKDISDELVQKYGVGQLNPQTGEFTPMPEPPAQS
jgi:uncharacterized protein involved in exopolysaccharide biosynthesis